MKLSKTEPKNTVLGSSERITGLTNGAGGALIERIPSFLLQLFPSGPLLCSPIHSKKKANGRGTVDSANTGVENALFRQIQSLTCTGQMAPKARWFLLRSAGLFDPAWIERRLNFLLRQSPVLVRLLPRKGKNFGKPVCKKLRTLGG